MAADSSWAARRLTSPTCGPSRGLAKATPTRRTPSRTSSATRSAADPCSSSRPSGRRNLWPEPWNGDGNAYLPEGRRRKLPARAPRLPDLRVTTSTGRPPWVRRSTMTLTTRRSPLIEAAYSVSRGQTTESQAFKILRGRERGEKPSLSRPRARLKKEEPSSKRACCAAAHACPTSTSVSRSHRKYSRYPEPRLGNSGDVARFPRRQEAHR
jgi:hypothetical protein